MLSEKEFWTQAARFVEFVHREAGMPAIVCDRQGIIRKAHVKSRVGTPHAGAQRILRGEVDEAEVTAEDQARNPNVREGYNSPIAFDGQRVATFGVAGKLEVSRPIARMAASVLSSWIEEAERQRLLGEAASQVVGAVKALSDRIGAAEEAAQAVSRRAEQASAAAAGRIDGAGGVLRTVEQVALQSRILAINGSVEASRAGETGRAFGVVAREMLGLAEEAKAAAVRVDGALGEIRGALADFEEALQASTADGRAHVDAMREVLKVAESLEEAMRRVTAGHLQEPAAAREAGPAVRRPVSAPSGARPRPAASPS